MIRNRSKGNDHITRRRLLKGAATGAGVAIGSGLVKGFPTIWAQNIKDVKLVHVGGSYSAINEIGLQATKDLGFTIEMQTADAMMPRLNRLVTQPKTIDIDDTEFFAQYYLVGRKIVLAPIPTAEVQTVGQDRTDLHQGRVSRRTQGLDPRHLAIFKVQYLESTRMAPRPSPSRPTELLTGIPTVYNADTLGIRPDLIGRPITIGPT